MSEVFSFLSFFFFLTKSNTEKCKHQSVLNKYIAIQQFIETVQSSNCIQTMSRYVVIK